jgi:hypothetical protein
MLLTISYLVRPPFTDKHRFFCADVTSLYPNISIAFGLFAVRSVCVRFNVFDTEELEFLMDLLEWVLRTNYIEFNKEHFLQTDGTSMGTPISVMYAIIVMFYIEDPLTIDMDFYKRFIDDFHLWAADFYSAELFMSILNTRRNSIKIEYHIIISLLPS